MVCIPEFDSPHISKEEMDRVLKELDALRDCVTFAEFECDTDDLTIEVTDDSEKK